MSDKIWLDSYAPGVPATVPEPPFRSIRDLVESSFREYADRAAFTCMGTTLSYRDLDLESARFAAYLQSAGLTRGERIASRIKLKITAGIHAACLAEYATFSAPDESHQGLTRTRPSESPCIIPSQIPSS